MSLHKEIQFENDICVHLAAHGPCAVSAAVTGQIDVRGG
jgi:hypothetical protein